MQQELRAERWSPGRPTRHEVRDPKRRIITTAPFVDRIVHQALCAEIGPRLDRHLIAHSYACRPGKGTHAAVRLRLHPWQVRRTREGVPWLGFRILPHELRVKRTSVNRAKARLARLSAEARHNGDPETFLRSLRATFAHWKHGTTWRLRAQVLRELGWLAPGATPASADEESGP